MTFSTMMERVGGSFHLGVTSKNISASRGSHRRRELLAMMPTREDHILLIGIFAGTGWKVRFSDDLESAYRILCQHPIAVVLYSRDFSGMDQNDALEILRSAPSHPSVLLVCPVKLRGDCARVNLPGFYSVIAKPLFEKKIIDAVEQAITYRDSHYEPTYGRQAEIPD